MNLKKENMKFMKNIKSLELLSLFYMLTSEISQLEESASCIPSERITPFRGPGGERRMTKNSDSISRHLFILVIIFLFGQNTFAQQSLDDYLVTAADNNPGLQSKFYDYMAAMERVPQVGVLPDPQVAFGYFVQPVETRLGPQQARIGVAQMFPWFGTLDAKKDVATEMAKAKYEIFAEAKSRLFYDVKSTWYNLYFTGKAIGITRENIDILQTLQRLALIKIESGEGSAVDELRVEMELLDLENQLELLSDKLEAQKIAFNNLLNVDSTIEIVVPDMLKTKDIPLNRQAILDSIKNNNHQVMALEFREASAMYQQKVAEKMGKPGFKIGVDYIFVGSSSNEMLSADESGKDAVILPKVGITVPLYRKKYTAMVQEAVFKQQSFAQERLDKENVLESIYEKANTDYQNAIRRIDLHTKQLDLSGKALRILQSEYATDGKNFEEILRMEKQVLMHGLELQKSRSDLNASVAFIDYLMGR